MSSTGSPAQMPMGLPTPQVVINSKKPIAKKQTKKPAAKSTKQASTRSDSESSDESELEIEAPDEPSPIPPARPTETEAAAQYDTLQAVWSPRNKWPGPEKVKTALVAYKDLVKALRDAWKEQVQAMKVAENQGDNAKAAQLKDQVTMLHLRCHGMVCDCFKSHIAILGPCQPAKRAIVLILGLTRPSRTILRGFMGMFKQLQA